VAKEKYLLGMDIVRFLAILMMGSNLYSIENEKVNNVVG
jgi:hypothetical protein